MEGIKFGPVWLECTLLLLCAFQLCQASVTVNVAPKVEVLKDMTATLPCTYTVSPSSSNTLVEWHIEMQGNRKRVAYRTQDGESKSDKGTPLSGRVSIGDDFSLTITSVQPTDGLVFFCSVTAGPAGNGEASTMLKVFFPPEKPTLTQASTQAISVGQSSSSEIGTCVTMNGHPQPRIIWFKDGQPLAEVKDRKEKTFMVPSLVKEASGLFTIKSTLYMQPTKADKDSVFQCTVEYSLPGDQILQKKSDTINLNLNYPSETATFTLLNKGGIKEGDEVTMKCETDGNPQPEFDFTKDGKPINGQGGLLILKSAKRTDAGLYTCKAIDFDNLDAELTGDVTLTVNYIDPMSVTPVKPQVVMFGDSVEWQCKTKASAPHTVQWKKGSEVLSQDGTLSITADTYEKDGEYMCVGAVPSVPGLTGQASAVLTIKGKPMIETPVGGEVSKEGDSVSLRCSAYGSPAPQFTWKPSGKQSVTVEGNKVVSTIIMPATAAIMKDGVTCEVANEHGTDSKTFTVSLKRANENSANRVLLSGNPMLESADQQQGGSSGVVIAVVVCVLLLLLLVALIYFLNKRSKLPCGKKDKKEVANRDVNNDIVVEMKTDKANEEAGLLNKRPPAEQ
ncbi:basal cell adhesion molecule isoform X1 [Corythoichthys intestinalis]|uniref:basal cell adhesion molecule isoform X1 n=1 Tax=Corythoichthys intestinalis TaxID=161448 RepID=UPI0025A574E7|nr:basal cell adhesion molecule isoform X1 [Corythoichthys intestinalis]